MLDGYSAGFLFPLPASLQNSRYCAVSPHVAPKCSGSKRREADCPGNHSKIKTILPNKNIGLRSPPCGRCTRCNVVQQPDPPFKYQAARRGFNGSCHHFFLPLFDGWMWIAAQYLNVVNPTVTHATKQPLLYRSRQEASATKQQRKLTHAVAGGEPSAPRAG